MALQETHSGLLGRHRWLLWTAGIVAGVVVLASFMSHGDVVPVQAATVERSTIRSVISTNGKVEPLRRTPRSAPP